MATAVYPVSYAEETTSGEEEVSVDYSLSPYIKRNNTIPGLRLPLLTGSIGDGGLGSGLRLNYSSAYSTEPKSDVIDCLRDEEPVLSPQVTSLAVTGSKISCANISEEDLDMYSADNCKFLSSCALSKTQSDMSHVANFLTGPRMAAHDYATLLLEDWLPAMEKLEALKKYSEKKFGAGFSASCRPQFETSEKEDALNCDKELVEKSFVNLINTCNQTTSLTCFNVGPDFGKNVPEGASALAGFMNGRVDGKVTQSLASDTEVLEQLGQILSSKEEKADAKLQAVFQKLKQLSADKKIDPVFGYEPDNLEPGQYSKSMHYEFFKNLSAKNLSLAAVKTEMEKHRRNTARTILSNDCSNSWNYGDICKKATSVSKGKSGLYVSRLRASSRFKALDATHTEYLKLVYPRGITSDKDARIFLNAHRCVALGVIPPANNSLGLDLTIGSGLDFGMGLRGPNSYWDKKPIEIREVKENKSELALLEGDAKFRPAQFEGPEIKKPVDFDASVNDNDNSLSDSFADNLKSAGNITSNNSSIGSGGFVQQPVLPVNQGYNFLSDLQTISENEGKKINSAPEKTDPLSEKISELTRKLNATEEHLAKLNEDKAAAEEEKAVQKKRDEDNQTIAELQKQIAALKAESAKSPEKQLAKPELSEAQPSRAIASAFREPAVEKKKEENEQAAAPTGDKGSSHNSSIASAVSDGGSSAKSVSAGSSSAASALGGKPLLVLSKSDGMTAEKITETINDKIIELGGQSFEIEENGVKIEIIPEVKNGKILLDAKGKPRYVKKIKGGKEALAKSRVPASVTDKADLLRKEEEAVKRERAEYLKLKNITNQAVQKKN